MREFFPFRAGRRLPELALLLGSCLSVSSCGKVFKKEPRVFMPPPMAARVPPPPAPAPELSGPPEIELDPIPEDLLIATDTLPDIPPPAVPPPPAKPKAAPPAVAELPQPEVPRPVQIFSPEQQRALLKEYEERIERVKGVLALVTTRNLNAEDRDTRTRIEAFRTQAEEKARSGDLVTAVELSRRADTLATDLYNRHR
jgi:hypothetical protein